MKYSSLHSPPAALNQGVARTVFNLVVDVNVLYTHHSRSRTRWLVLPHSGRLVAESTRCKDGFLWSSDRETHENYVFDSLKSFHFPSSGRHSRSRTRWFYPTAAALSRNPRAARMVSCGPQSGKRTKIISWPFRDRLTAVSPLQVVWPHDMPRPLSLSPAAPCTHSTPRARA
jgi:hypothetical protein